MNHLLRALAPISDAGWQLLDEEARQRLEPALAARKLVDFRGPHGWEHSATNLGRTAALDVGADRRRLGPAAARAPARRAARADFELSRDELRDADRGADDPDLARLDEAAQQDRRAPRTSRVFHGWTDALAGIAEALTTRAGSAR